MCYVTFHAPPKPKTMRIHIPVFQTFVQIITKNNSFKDIYMTYCYKNKGWESMYEIGYARYEKQYHGSKDIQRFIKR